MARLTQLRHGSLGAFLAGVLAACGCDESKPTSAAPSASASATPSPAALLLPDMPSAQPAPKPPAASEAPALEKACGLPKAKTKPLPQHALQGNEAAPSASAPQIPSAPSPEAAACAQLAILYSTGEAGEVNHEHAFALRIHACRLGGLKACVLAGAGLAIGDGSKTDMGQAVAL